MAPVNTTTFDPILKEFYLPLFVEQYNRQMVLMDEVIMRRDSEHVEGKNAYIAVEWESWAGTGSRDEEEDFPDPEPGDYDRVAIPMRYHYAAFRITGQVLEASRTDAGAFAQAIQREMKSKITAFHKHHNRMMWGDGSGTLCQVDGSPTAGALTLTVDNAYGIANAINGNMFFSKNVWIDIYSAKSAGTYRGTFKVTGVTKGSGASTSAILTLNAAPEASGVIDGDYLFLKGARGKEMMGLLGIIDAGNFVTTLQGLSNTTDPDWAAQIRQGTTPGTAQGLSTLRMMQLYNDVVWNGGGDPRIIIGNPNMVLTYAMMAKREGIMMNAKTLDAGWTGVEFGGTNATILADKYAPPNRFAFIDPDSITMYEMARPQWLDRGEGVLSRVGRTEVYEAIYYHYAEMGVSRRMSNGMLEDVVELT